MASGSCYSMVGCASRRACPEVGLRPTWDFLRHGSGGELTCDSQDGLRARSGKVCETCEEQRCQPMLRIQLQSAGEILLVLDLATSSVRNLFALEDRIVKQGRSLGDVELKFTVIDRG